MQSRHGSSKLWVALDDGQWRQFPAHDLPTHCTSPESPTGSWLYLTSFKLQRLVSAHSNTAMKQPCNKSIFRNIDYETSPELIKFFFDVVVQLSEENIVQGLSLLLHKGLHASVVSMLMCYLVPTAWGEDALFAPIGRSCPALDMLSSLLMNNHGHRKFKFISTRSLLPSTKNQPLQKTTNRSDVASFSAINTWQGEDD